MTTLTFPSVSPNSSVFTPISNSQDFTAITGAVQIRDLEGERWRADLSYVDLTAAQRAEMEGFLVDMVSRQNRVLLPVHGISQQGSFGGTPLVAGASQLGDFIDLDGASLSITNWIRRGDWLSFSNELKMCRQDASSDGAGDITVQIWPRIRSAPADNAAVEVTAPTGLFLLATQSVQWRNVPGSRSSLSFTLVEDIA